MTAEGTIRTFRREQRRAVAAAVAAVVTRWRSIDPDAIVDSWHALLPTVVDDLTTAQLAAARSGAAYVPRLLAAQGLTSNAAGTVNAAALTGIASDGRPLDTLMGVPARQTLGRIGAGMATSEALAVGRRRAGMLALTMVADVGRAATSIGMVSDRTVTGYRRQISPPACARCAVLAGKWFRWNQGFQRHPSCQCVHVPATGPKSDVAGLETFDPDAYFDGLDAGEQDRLFTRSGAQAIRDGADMNQVVNARRGMRTAFDPRYGRTVATTLEGTTARASAGRLLRGRATSFGRDVEVQPGLSQRIAARPMPEEIYRAADGNREVAISALARWGYLNG